MTWIIGKQGAFSGLFVVTRVPRAGGINVDNARIDTDMDGNAPAYRLWQARKWATRASAEKALAIVHAAGWDDYSLMERADM